MSKTKRALAVLGVVAGLGVAALPLSSYAAPINDGGTGDLDGGTEAANGSVADSLKVKTTIQDTLSIEIVGNDDTHAVDTTETASHVVLIGKDGEQLTGVLANGTASEGVATVTVATNNAQGYNLYLKGATAALVGSVNTNTIPAVGANPTMNGTASEWGYKTAANAAAASTNGTIGGLKENWTAVTTENAVIATNTAPTHTNGDVIDLTFGASVSPSQAADTYSDVVTLTASATPATPTPATE